MNEIKQPKSGLYEVGKQQGRSTVTVFHTCVPGAVGSSWMRGCVTAAVGNEWLTDVGLI